MTCKKNLGIITHVVLTILVIILCTGCLSGGGLAKTYLAHNIWFQNPGDVWTINFKSGDILPVGTEVVDITTGKRRFEFVSFKVADTGQEFTFVIIPRYNPGITPEIIIDRTFTSRSKEQQLKKFTGTERNLIVQGKVEAGMTKDAVIASFGYPPSNRTPSLEAHKWVYFVNRFNRIEVRFDASDKVIEVVN